MAADLISLAFSGFDRKLAYEIYCRWVASSAPGDLQVAWEAAVPAVGVVYSRAGFADNGKVTEREYVSAGSWEIYWGIKQQAFRGDSATTYASYLQRISLNAFLTETSQWASRRFMDFDYHGHQTPTGRVESIADVEQRLYIEQLPRLLAYMVTPRLRFDGSRHEACLHVLWQVLSSSPVSTRRLCKEFGLSREDADLVIDYVLVRVRLALKEVRDDTRERWTDLCAAYTPPERVYAEL